MTIKFKDIDYTFPESLTEITLGKRIQFYHEHGIYLDKQAAIIDTIEDDFEKELSVSAWHLELAARTFSFYTGIALASVHSDIAIVELLTIYNNEMQSLFIQEKETELLQQYQWNNEKWILATPEVLPTSKVCFNEFIYAKEIVRQLSSLSKNKWDMLPYLCAIYLRKEGEYFNEEFCIEGGERYKLMLELPLNIAIAVGFFLSGTVNIYTTISVFSEKESLKASAQPAISTDGDGKHS